jgi:hypothetical protein
MAPVAAPENPPVTGTSTGRLLFLLPSRRRYAQPAQGLRSEGRVTDPELPALSGTPIDQGHGSNIPLRLPGGTARVPLYGDRDGRETIDDVNRDALFIGSKSLWASV